MILYIIILSTYLRIKVDLLCRCVNTLFHYHDTVGQRSYERYGSQQSLLITVTAMWFQKEVKLKSRSRGFHLVTDEILHQIPEISTLSIGMMNLFIKHTSASLTINENADPTVRQDFESYFSRAVPEDEPYYKHTYEGSDDLPAHFKNSLLGCNVNIPITDGKLNMGIWQGIYLCEHRNYGTARTVVVTLQGE